MNEDRSQRTGSAEPPGELNQLEEANLRLLGEARLLLALAMMLVVLAGSPQPSPVIIVLLPYGCYGALVMLWARHRASTRGLRQAHWIDAAVYLAAIALSGGYDSDLFLALLFPILLASMRAGLGVGTAVTIGCTLLFAAVGALVAWSTPRTAFEPAALWSVATLLLVGLVIARWGSAEYSLLRRLAFLNDVKRLATPRYGLSHAMCQLAALLRAYLRAESCIVLLTNTAGEGYLLCESSARRAGESLRGERVLRDTAAPLLGAPPSLAMIYSKRRHFWQRDSVGGYEHASLKPRPVDSAALEELANLLETDSLVSLPLYCRDRPVGRLYATSTRHRYARSDLRFLQQAVGHAALVIDTIQLVDRLASDMATQERQRISRDLHDGTIQPYIGLKLGLEALRRRMPEADPLAGDLADLTRMADAGVAELRSYVAGLKEKGITRGPDSLLVAIRRQVDKFHEYYGLKVQVQADSDFRLKDAMQEEVMHIVREGLANIRRHTAARRATVRLRDRDGRLVVEFVNKRPAAGPAPQFFPRSLNERAAGLGGRVDVEQRHDGRTRVAVEIPV